MSRQIQIRRGTAAEHDNFTGALGEITMDTTNKTLRIHDGVTNGGNEIMSSNKFNSMITNCMIQANIWTFAIITRIFLGFFSWFSMAHEGS